MSDDVVCKGSYSFGTACGQCKKCNDELMWLIEDLIESRGKTLEAIMNKARRILEKRKK